VRSAIAWRNAAIAAEPVWWKRPREAAPAEAAAETPAVEASAETPIEAVTETPTEAVMEDVRDAGIRPIPRLRQPCS